MPICNKNNLGDKWAEDTSRHFIEETEMARKHEKMFHFISCTLKCILKLKKQHFLATKLAATKKSENNNNWRDTTNRNLHPLLACKPALPLWKTVLSSEVEHKCILQPRIYALRETRAGAGTQDTQRNGHNTVICNNQKGGGKESQTPLFSRMNK